ncbi:hypothetical protein JD81_04485 [Micromonospora sagamiensis]|uniref:Uncharacterized protein n=1 Tax=Micromonospora sagamiensis TaxID=47875 RepID=A0A562WL61_9ACTN|nr:hypothetical protein JD81_04485 [Micromonospora sagamiensis]
MTSLARPGRYDEALPPVASTPASLEAVPGTTAVELPNGTRGRSGPGWGRGERGRGEEEVRGGELPARHRQVVDGLKNREEWLPAGPVEVTPPAGRTGCRPRRGRHSVAGLARGRSCRTVPRTVRSGRRTRGQSASGGGQTTPGWGCRTVPMGGWLRRDAIPPATDPGKPSRPGPGRQGRTSGRALHLVALALARSTVCGSAADSEDGGVGRRVGLTHRQTDGCCPDPDSSAGSVTLPTACHRSGVVT